MKICGTCEQPLEDQIEICPRCQMKGESHDLPAYIPRPRWTLFPPIPKTHWWGTELEPKAAGRNGPLGSVVSKGIGVVAVGPNYLNLGVGRYEFRCLFTVDHVPGRELEVGTIRVMGHNGAIASASRRIKGEDFDLRFKEAHIAIEFQLDEPTKDIYCEFKSNDKGNKAGLGLTWLRLVPRFGWRWNRWDRKSLIYHELSSISERGITLRADLGEGAIKLWGPYIYLPSGSYELIASVLLDHPENSLVASWEVTVNKGEEYISRIPIRLDFSQQGKQQIVSRKFCLESAQTEVEFRIWVEEGDISVEWLHLIPREGAIWEKYYELGGRDSVLGLPSSAEGEASPAVNKTEGRYRRFERGTIYFNNKTFQAWEVWGAISSLYEKLGGTGATGIGFPIKSIHHIQSSHGTVGEFQRFEGWGKPAIFAYPSNRTHICAIYGAISSAYWERGGPEGPLGFPTSKNEYYWPKGEITFRRSDFEGGYITWSEEQGISVHLYPKPHIEIECKDTITRGEELVIKVIGELEGGPIRCAWCTVSFRDPIEPVEPKPIIVEGGSQDPQSQIAWPGTTSSGNYGKSSYQLRYPRVEMGRWGEWPDAPGNSFTVKLRPASAGTFRIFARFTVQDGFDDSIFRGDPSPSWLDLAYNRDKRADIDLLGIDSDRNLKIVRDQQDEAVYVYEV